MTSCTIRCEELKTCRRVDVALKRKIFLRTAGLLLILVACISFAMGVFFVKRNIAFETRRAKEGIEFLAKRTTRLLLWDDRIGLQSLLSEAVQETSSLSYCRIERDGKAYVDTFGSGIPKALLTLHKKPVKTFHSVAFKSTTGDRLIEMALPVGQTEAVLYGGFSVKKMNERAYGALGVIAAIALAVTAAGICLAERSASLITKEVQSITSSLEHAKEKAELATRAKGSFLTHVSNEFSYPLNTVTGMANLLQNSPLDEKQRTCLDSIFEAQHCMASLINDMVDYAKLEKEEIELEAFAFDFRLLVEKVMQLYRSRAAQQGLHFSCEIQPEVPAYVVGDPGRVRRILANMISNAIRYTREGGVSVRISLEQETQSDVGIRFVVDDTGIGIEPERLENVLEALAGKDEACRSHMPHIGLGLFISKKLIEAMGGSLSVESQASEGTTFSFVLTLAKQEKMPLPATALTDSLHKRRVLIADGSISNRYVLSQQFVEWGMACEEAGDKEEALKKIRAGADGKKAFDVVIIDKALRGDGCNLGKAVKTDKNLYRTALIMTAAIGERGDAARMFNAGFEAYLTGPVDSALLYDCLRTVLSLGERPFGALLSAIITRHSLLEDRKRRVRILCAENTDGGEQAISPLIEKLGYQVTMCANGRDAADALDKHRFDLLLLDMVMPELGIEVINRISSVAEEQAVSIVGLLPEASSIKSKIRPSRTLKRMLAKPVQLAVLSKTVEEEISFCLEKRMKRGTTRNRGGSGVFDRESLLSKFEDDRELLKNLVRVLHASIPQRLEEIRTACRNQDGEKVTGLARALKTICANADARELRENAAAVEMAGSTGELHRIPDLLVRFEEAFGRFREMTKDLQEA